MKSITCEQLNRVLESNQPPLVLDVRNVDEFAGGCIPAAKNIPLHLLPLKLKQELPDKHAAIVVNCKSGGRSAQACALLEKNGYTNIQNLEGGFDAYCNT